MQGWFKKLCQNTTQQTIETMYSIAGHIVDGRTVLQEVPNTSSIASSLEDYITLNGIREISMSALDTEPPQFYSISEKQRTQKLAEQIKMSGQISPLIVVHDNEGLYVLEGAHRFDALKILGAKSFPALVVIDEGSINSMINQEIPNEI